MITQLDGDMVRTETVLPNGKTLYAEIDIRENKITIAIFLLFLIFFSAGSFLWATGNTERQSALMCSARSSVSVMGSKQGGVRPTLAVQNDAGNRYSDVSIAVIIFK